MRLIEEPYRTPDGWLDFPFAYVFDATGIADGQAQVMNLAKPLQGDSDFILRRIVGVNNCVTTAEAGGRFNYRNASSSYAFGNTSLGQGIYVQPNWIVLPEKRYPYNTQISFDLFNTQRSYNLCLRGRNFISYIAFFGVKRFPKQQGYRSNTTPYKYREQKYSYSVDLTLTVPYQTNPAPVRFHQIIDNYDFELQRIAVSSAGEPVNADDFLIQLYDSNGHQLSDMPLNLTYVDNARTSWHTTSDFGGIFPVPTLVYPAGSAITFDLTCLLCTAQLPKTYNIAFEGIWRRPC